MSTRSKFRDPDGILKIDPVNGFCVGHVKSKSRRCTKPVNAQNLAAAKVLIDVMDEEDDLLNVKRHLQKLASLTLCREWHNSSRANRRSYNQIDEITSNWKELVDNASRLKNAKENTEAKKSEKAQKTSITRDLHHAADQEKPEVSQSSGDDLDHSESEAPVEQDGKIRVQTIDELLKRLENTITEINASMEPSYYEPENIKEETDDIVNMELQPQGASHKEARPVSPSESNFTYITPPTSPRTIQIQTIVDQHPIEDSVTLESKREVQYPALASSDTDVGESLPISPQTKSRLKGKTPIDREPLSPSPTPDLDTLKAPRETIDGSTDGLVIFPQVPQQINIVRLQRVATSPLKEVPNHQARSPIPVPAVRVQRGPLENLDLFPKVPQNSFDSGPIKNKGNGESQDYNLSDISRTSNSPSPVSRTLNEENEKGNRQGVCSIKS
ncbi:hypothetical protein F5884DRAFT_211929 [Xylogone sp. PMI_703]|nr:hypothetical protein F5884DRAFT_211929 [Xylogone sp. PMI_703]